MTATESSEDRAATIRDDRRSLYRAAGIGGIGAFVAWLGQPVVVGIFSPLVPENGPDFAYIRSTPFNGAIEATLFTAIGVGTLFLVLGAGRLVAPSSTGARVGQTLGVIASLGWFLAAGSSLAMYTSVGWFLSEAAPDPALQQALYQTLGIATTGSLLLFGLGFAGWLILLATAGRRAAVIGWPLAITSLVGAAVLIGALWVPFAPPWGLFAGEAMFLVLGIAFLVKAGRAR